MDIDKIPETKASRKFRLFLDSRVRVGMVLGILSARGLTPSDTERARLAAVKEPELLDLIARNAATATTVEEALAPVRRAPSARAASGRSARRPPRRSPHGASCGKKGSGTAG